MLRYYICVITWSCSKNQLLTFEYLIVLKELKVTYKSWYNGKQLKMASFIRALYKVISKTQEWNVIFLHFVLAH